MFRAARRGVVAVLALLLLPLGLAPASATDLLHEEPPSTWTWDAAGWGWSLSPMAHWYTGPHGTFPVPRHEPYDLSTVHRSLGGGRGALGYPLTPPLYTSEHGIPVPGWFQRFERGTAIVGPSGAGALVQGSAITRWWETTGIALPIGGPLGVEVTQAPGWWYHQFSNGYVYHSRFGTYGVVGALSRAHVGLGGGSGLGYPIGPEVREGWAHSYQVFERGVVYCREDGPYARWCHAVDPRLDAYHRANGGGTGWLGYPVGEPWYDRSRTAWVQDFERERLYWRDGRVFFYAATTH